MSLFGSAEAQLLAQIQVAPFRVVRIEVRMQQRPPLLPSPLPGPESYSFLPWFTFPPFLLAIYLPQSAGVMAVLVEASPLTA